MENLDALGNAAAIPIVIAITQVIKQKLNINWRTEIVALVTAFVICIGWEFYSLDTLEGLRVLNTPLSMFKFIVDLLIKSFATWLSASKIYDLTYGDKKQEKEIEKTIQNLEDQHLQSTEILKEKHRVETILGEEADGQLDMDDFSAKLSKILEEN